MVVEYLHAVIALYVFFLNDVETDRAQEGVDKFLIGIKCIFFVQFVVSCQTKDIIIGCFVYPSNKVLCLFLRIFFEPCIILEWTLVMSGHGDIIIWGGWGQNHFSFILLLFLLIYYNLKLKN